MRSKKEDDQYTSILDTKESPHLVIIAVVVRALVDALETPTVHLAHERRILSMAEEERYDLFLECPSLMNTPRPAVREPRYDIFECWIRQDGVELCNERWLFLGSWQLYVAVVVISSHVGRLNIRIVDVRHTIAEIPQSAIFLPTFLLPHGRS